MSICWNGYMTIHNFPSIMKYKTIIASNGRNESNIKPSTLETCIPWSQIYFLLLYYFIGGTSVNCLSFLQFTFVYVLVWIERVYASS